MLIEMRELALQDLLHRCKETPETDMAVIRERHGHILSPLLVENSEKIPRVYILTPREKEGKMIVKMHVEEMDKEKVKKLPFIQRGKNPAIGPTIKRTYNTKKKPPLGPTSITINTTLKGFEKQATSNDYFKEIVETLNSKILEYQGRYHSLTDEQNILEYALELIDEKSTVFVAVADRQGKLPGERIEYLQHLANEIGKGIKYITKEALIHKRGNCPLCGKQDITLYPNAVKGGGLGIGNVDRAGAFTGLNTKQAWKGFGLCLDCADLLYVFKNYLLPQFIAPVAGEKALLLPSLLGPVEKHQKFIRTWRNYIRNLETDKIASYEEGLLKFFAKQEDNQVTLQIIWATFGQTMDDVKGWITDILPSRLQELSGLNDDCNEWHHPFAPEHPIDEAKFDLGLNMLLPLFRRPGGKIAKKANESKQLFDFKGQLAIAIYHKKRLTNKERDFLWYQVTETARWHLIDVIKRKSEKKIFLTFAGWIRHLARFFYYLDQTGVLPMEPGDLSFKPQTETLKPFFAEGSGINSDAKAFAFILGALFGKLIQVQSRRGVNVNSNALIWLKRLELSGKDLPELYTKIRSKFFAYSDFKKNQTFLDLEKDLGYLGAKLGNEIDLDKTATCYFLLLGQSVATHVFPKKETIQDNLTQGTLL